MEKVGRPRVQAFARILDQSARFNLFFVLGSIPCARDITSDQMRRFIQVRRHVHCRQTGLFLTCTLRVIYFSKMKRISALLVVCNGNAWLRATRISGSAPSEFQVVCGFLCGVATVLHAQRFAYRFIGYLDHHANYACG